MRRLFKMTPVPFSVVVAAVVPAMLSGCDSSSATATISPPNAAAKADADAKVVSTAADAAQVGRRPKLLPGAKTKVLAAAGDKPYDKTFDDLRFEMKVDEPFRREMLSESIEGMFGHRIRIRGFMLPTPQKNGIKEFVLVRDNQECCFGPGAALYDCIYVQMKAPQRAEFSIRPVTLEGAFDFKEIVVEGRHWAIYHLLADSAR